MRQRAASAIITGIAGNATLAARNPNNTVKRQAHQQQPDDQPAIGLDLSRADLSGVMEEDQRQGHLRDHLDDLSHVARSSRVPPLRSPHRPPRK